MRLLLLTVLTTLYCTLTNAQTPTGTWRTVDERSGETKAYVKLFEQNGRYYGRIIRVVEANYVNTCNKCEGDRRNQPIENLLIIENVKPGRSGRTWRGGTILDPKTGRTFGFSMWFERGKTDELKVRGKHWSGVYRTQRWYRVNNNTNI